MKINYGINRRTPRPGNKKRLEHRNGQIEIDGDWNSSTFHGQLRQRIIGAHPGWSITGYAIAPEELREISVWSRGFHVTGEQAGPMYHGHCRATSLQDACDYLFMHHPSYNKEDLTLYGCDLFDNEADARKSCEQE